MCCVDNTSQNDPSVWRLLLLSAHMIIEHVPHGATIGKTNVLKMRAHLLATDCRIWWRGRRQVDNERSTLSVRADRVNGNGVVVACKRYLCYTTARVGTAKAGMKPWEMQFRHNCDSLAPLAARRISGGSYGCRASLRLTKEGSRDMQQLDKD
jgi:hypothetical protein